MNILNNEKSDKFNSKTTKYSDDDEESSVASTLSDYNGIFYDACSINSELIEEDLKLSEKTYCNNQLYNNNNNKKDSMNSSFDSNRIEEDDELDLNNFEDTETKSDASDEIAEKTKLNADVHLEELHTKSNDETENDEFEDEDIKKEFEEYLNDEEPTFADSNTADFKQLKLKKLENMEFDRKNLHLLRQMAIEKFGFVNKKFRRKAWPLLLLNVDQENVHTMESFDKITSSQIKSNRYFHQVTLDVVRTLKRFPPEISDKLRAKLQKQLIDVIVKILVQNENLHYYQGYHDICLTFLLVTGAQESLPLIESLTLSHLTKFMETTMETTMKLLFNIMPLIDRVNERVAEHIQKAELGVIFCISWLITWYSHVMENLKIILRLYDLFIATDSLMPIYLGAVMVCEHGDEILDIECDMASLHTVITKLPLRIDDNEVIEEYILKALSLYKQCPPETLSELNEKWLNKCKRIQEEKQIYEEEMQILRQRKKKRNNKSDSDDDDNQSNAKGGQKKASKRNQLTRYNKNNKQIANRFIVGLTFTVGVAAVAMYAINTNIREPQELLSKVYQFMSYKTFI